MVHRCPTSGFSAFRVGGDGCPTMPSGGDDKQIAAPRGATDERQEARQRCSAAGESACGRGKFHNLLTNKDSEVWGEFSLLQQKHNSGLWHTQGKRGKDGGVSWGNNG